MSELYKSKLCLNGAGVRMATFYLAKLFAKDLITR